MVQRDRNYWRMKYYDLLGRVQAGEFKGKAGHDTVLQKARELVIILRETSPRTHADDVLLMHLASFLYANGEATPNG